MDVGERTQCLVQSYILRPSIDIQELGGVKINYKRNLKKPGYLLWPYNVF